MAAPQERPDHCFPEFSTVYTFQKTKQNPKKNNALKLSRQLARLAWQSDN